MISLDLGRQVIAILLFKDFLLVWDAPLSINYGNDVDGHGDGDDDDDDRSCDQQGFSGQRYR